MQVQEIRPNVVQAAIAGQCCIEMLAGNFRNLERVASVGIREGCDRNAKDLLK